MPPQCFQDPAHLPTYLPTRHVSRILRTHARTHARACVRACVGRILETLWRGACGSVPAWDPRNVGVGRVRACVDRVPSFSWPWVGQYV